MPTTSDPKRVSSLRAASEVLNLDVLGVLGGFESWTHLIVPKIRTAR